ncbi:MAG: hypothetical protein WCT16_00615 [Candidatus Buchananbacteria bacterium]
MSLLSYLKLKNNWRPLIVVIILIGAVIINLLLSGGVIKYLAFINFIFAALVVMVNLRSIGESFIFAVVSGIILDIYSGLPFGLTAASLLLAAAAMEILIANIFSNRSFYSLVGLGAIGLVIYRLIFALLTQGLFFFGFTDATIGWNFWLQTAQELILTSVLLIVVFFIIDRWSNSFRPNYLSR